MVTFSITLFKIFILHFNDSYTQNRVYLSVEINVSDVEYHVMCSSATMNSCKNVFFFSLHLTTLGWKWNANNLVFRQKWSHPVLTKPSAACGIKIKTFRQKKKKKKVSWFVSTSDETFPWGLGNRGEFQENLLLAASVDKVWLCEAYLTFTEIPRESIIYFVAKWRCKHNCKVFSVVPMSFAKPLSLELEKEPHVSDVPRQ